MNFGFILGGLERRVRDKKTSIKNKLLRGVCSLAIGFSPFIGNTRAIARGLDEKIKVAEEEEFAVGSVTYTTDSPVGGGSFSTGYAVGASSGPEDDSFQDFIPPFPGTTYTTMNDGDCSYRLDPAGTSPGTGTCPSVTVHLGPGAVVEVPSGAMWHTTASADFTGTKGTVWKATITDAYGSISPGRYEGGASGSSFSFGGPASISYTVISSSKPSIDPNNTDPNNVDPNKPPVTTTSKPINPDPEFGKTDPYPFSKYPKSTILLEHFIDWEGNGSFVRDKYDNDKTGELIIHWREDIPQNYNSLDASKNAPRSRIYARGAYNQVPNQELRSIGAKRTDNVLVYLGVNPNTKVFTNTPQKILARLHVGATEADFQGDKITFWTYTGEPGKSNYTEGPIYDLSWHTGKDPNGNNGIIRAKTLQGIYGPETAIVSRTRMLGDIVWDGKVDTNDYNLVIACLGPFGGVANVAGKERKLGRPSADGLVNEDDLWALHNVLPDDVKATVTPPDQVIKAIQTSVKEPYANVSDAIYMRNLHSYSPEVQAYLLLQQSRAEKPVVYGRSDHSIISR